MRSVWVVFVVVLGLVRMAAADDPAPTVIEGRVTDIVNRPMANARVHVVASDGQGTAIDTTTDGDGRYRVEVASEGTYRVVIGVAKGHVFRTVLVKPGEVNTLDVDVELDTSGGEVIKIVDSKRPLPAVKAKPVKDPRALLPYSDEAVKRDAWARAWLLLDIDETGHVTRIKLLKAPGFDLDKICIETALALVFEPARDAQGRVMKNYLLWKMEWPAWGWLAQGDGVALRLPKDRTGDPLLDAESKSPHFVDAQAAGTMFGAFMDKVPCAGSGPLNLDLKNRTYRDCSRPDLSNLASLPWITKQNMTAALVEIQRGTVLVGGVAPEKPQAPGARWPGYVALGFTGAFAVASVASYLQFDKYQSRVEDGQWQHTIDPVAAMENSRQQRRWGRITLGLTAATLATGGITLLIWNRDAPRSSFSVQPSDQGRGATAAYTKGW